MFIKAIATTYTATADDLSLGKRFWERQERRLRNQFTRIVGDEKLQRCLDFQYIARAIRDACPTWGPCSRECVGL